MYKIQKLNQIAASGIEKFDPSLYDIAESCTDPEGILVRSKKITPEDLGKNLMAIARAGAGVNNIPVHECSKRGIPVFNTPGANANAVKELVLAGLILGSRGVIPGIEYVKSLKSDDKDFNELIEKEKKRFKGQEIAGKTLGVVGLGAIGSLVAEMGLMLGMRVLGHDPKISIDAAWKLSSRVEKKESIEALFAESDYVSLHLPVLDSTRGVINSKALEAFRHGACLLNFARHELVDQEAIIQNLLSGRLKHYVTDFPTPTLLDVKGTIAIPHLGASTIEAEENCAKMAVSQISDYLENGNIVNGVNFPNMTLPRRGAGRIAVANINVPKILGKVLAILSERNMNVVEMINKSRGELAYNLIDVETPVTKDIINSIMDLDDVLMVRSI